MDEPCPFRILEGTKQARKQKGGGGGQSKHPPPMLWAGIAT